MVFTLNICIFLEWDGKDWRKMQKRRRSIRMDLCSLYSHQNIIRFWQKKVFNVPTLDNCRICESFPSK